MSEFIQEMPFDNELLTDEEIEGLDRAMEYNVAKKKLDCKKECL